MAKELSKSKKSSIRIELQFEPDGVQRLEEIAKKSGDNTKAETVRNALRLYEWYLDQKSQGYKLQLARPKDKYVREVDLIF